MAGRKSKPWFWSKRRAWFVTIDGKRTSLGSDKVEAFRRFHELMAGIERPKKGVVCVGKPPTLKALVDRYFVAFGRRAKPATCYSTRCYLNPLLKAFGEKPVDRLTPADVDAAVLAHGKWNQTTEHHARSRLVAVLRWAVKNRLIESNPLAGLWRPPALSRGADIVPAEDATKKLLEAAPEYLRNVLLTLQQTGARPCEVLTVTAADFDAAAGVWILKEHKTAHKTGRPRVIFLTPQVVELCKRLAEKYPTGPLFRRALGTPFPSAYYLPRLVRNLRRKLSLPETVIPYAFRHGFATSAVAAGIPTAHVAELLGHTNTAMVERVYSHLGTKAAVLRAALEKVR
jgi:integrase